MTETVAVASSVEVNVGDTIVGDDATVAGVSNELVDAACTWRLAGASVRGADVEGLQAETKMDATASQNNKRTFIIAPSRQFNPVELRKPHHIIQVLPERQKNLLNIMFT